MTRIVKSPLFWFLVIGALIFAADRLAFRAPGQIIVDDRVLGRISALWQQQMSRPPSENELRNLVRNWIDEEVLLREAKRLRLDDEDVIVRRRLVQKMHFIAEEADSEPPGEKTLTAYFAANQDKYRLPRRFTFSHVFRREKPSAEFARELNAAAVDAWRGMGDATMQRATYVQQSAERVASEFGTKFSEGIAALDESDTWQGPIESAFGWHMVRMESVDESEIPSFVTVRHMVLNDYLFEAKSKARQRQLAEVKEDYEVLYRGSAKELFAP